MGHVVFLLGPYYPNYSAVGYCVYQVQKCLTHRYDVTAVAFRDDPALAKEQSHENTQIRRIETPDMKLRNAVSANEGGLARLWFLGLRVRSALRKLFTRETIDWTLVEAYHDQLKAITPIPNAIVPTIFPFETILAALAYQKEHPKTCVFPYIFDDFVESGSLHVLKIARFLKRKRHLKLERKALEDADGILAMHPLRSYFESNLEKRLLGKITFLEHPLLSRPLLAGRQTNDGTLRFCYTGSLIHGVREPNYLLDLLGGIQQEMPIQADFYVMGNAANTVKTETIGGDIAIKNCGKVRKAEADLAVIDADVLLNIGEVRGRQVSSKVFEYMSTGKPIIHLAYVEDDAVSNILSKYPLALCLVQSRSAFAQNLRQVEKFLLETYAKELSFDEVKAIYPEALPETTAAVFEDMLRQKSIFPNVLRDAQTGEKTSEPKAQVDESKNDD